MLVEDAGPDPSTTTPLITEPGGLTERPLRPIVSSASYDMIQQTDQARADECRA